MTDPVESRTRADTESVPPTTSAFLPVLILGLVMLAWFVFQAIQMRSERASMREVVASQEKQMDEAKHLRDAFDSLVRGTAELAANGNPNAKLVVDDLKSHGVPIPSVRPPNAADDRTSR